ncbi:threonine synthase [Streptomyces physcomitrii]|uniref:Pyridoxal-phosphate dependent enzyme n=1 Tax=Streptomyces physcomitrii TaxID=2724184 RepID=A0ABX1GV45_9ACTN|nr:threonine synthase [Streptomyces physcomitrii]NKI39941.1 pyridoxal-phosphate dependent enzyme [Streptomyces physcomitrii]
MSNSPSAADPPAPAASGRLPSPPPPGRGPGALPGPLPDSVCPVDGTRVPAASLDWCCPRCRGPLDLDFHGRPAGLDALTGRVNSLWRYAETLPLAAPAVSLGEGRTPLVALTDTVSAKLDFLMPTLSFKDRGAVLLAELARRLGPERVLADSSGNAGTAIAAYCARAGLPCTVYVPAATSAKKLEQIAAHGARLETVDGDRQATALAARAAADAPGTFYASHVHNPYFLHGTKTYVHELWEDLGGHLPERLVVPVGNGTLLLGAALALTELHTAGLLPRRPRLIAVQSAAVAPLARAWQEGADDLLDDTPASPTLAEGIAIPRPPRARQILRAVRESGGEFRTVTEPQIRTAQRDLAARGFYVETTGVACWAAVREEARGPSTVVPLCGAGVKTGVGV